ncbi:MAG: hypothetical protein M1296_07415 [Chloroflexi bacterium]|nr:hypothetical protein [Chloroflexota bacterium]
MKTCDEMGSDLPQCDFYGERIPDDRDDTPPTAAGASEQLCLARSLRRQ